ncbi:MAG TPA: hypothetical protein VGA85_07200 [Dehalococcoidales bacterium]
MSVLTQYSIVCQVPGAESYIICAYNGKDLTQVLGITQTNLPEGHYGWIQECGEVLVNTGGQTKAAYVDFRPSAAKRNLTEALSKRPQEQAAELPPSAMSKSPYDTRERLSQLPPLLMEAGVYCALIREARDVFVNGHFYACVAMCGISLERFQRDRAAHFGAARKKIEEVRRILQKNKILLPETIDLCRKMAKLRDKYAHGHGANPKEDALKALAWMHSFIDKETNLMRDYVIVDGTLHRDIKR